MYHIDITFIDDFINLVGKDEFCISHDMLLKYGILHEHDTSHIKLLFEQHNSIEMRIM